MTSERHAYSLEQLGMAIRPVSEADYGLIYDSMINSYHKGSPEAKCVRMSSFKKHVRNILDNALTPTTAIVVCSSTDSSVIHGWAIVDGQRLVYVYVQQLWRSKGVASAMIALLRPKSYACWTFPFKEWSRRLNLEFVPLWLQPISK